MAALVRAFAWSATPLGPIEAWPDGLRTVVGMVLSSPFVSSVALLDDRLLIYNDAAARLYGVHHPAALGQALAEAFPDAYPIVAGMYDRVYRGETVTVRSQPLAVGADASGEIFDAYLVPVRAADGSILGAHMVGLEIGSRVRAEATLRDSEERQAFLLKLSDTLRPIGDPVEVMVAASEALGRYLGAGRCGYGEVDASGEFFIVERDWTDGKMASFRGEHRLVSFGSEFTAAYRAGRSVLIEDALADARAAGAEAAFEAAGGVRASLGVPLIKDGRFVAGLFVQQIQPRHWNKDEEALARAILERTWDAIERARSERALARSEDKYRTLFGSIDEGVTTIELIYDEHGTCVDARYGESNPALERMTGLHDVEGKLLSEVVPDLEPTWLERYARVVRTGEPERFVDYAQSLGRWFDVHASRVDGADSRQCVQVYTDITERKRIEAAVQESEERQVFLLKLSDALRPLSDPVEVQTTAAGLIGKHFSVDRANYYEVDPDGWVTRSHGYVSGEVAVPEGFWIDEFGHRWAESYWAGRTDFVSDVAIDDRFSDADREKWRANRLSAALGVPLIKEGRLCTILGFNNAEPHCWTNSEIALAKEVAERTWAAVERARAEAALRHSEERHRLMLELVPALLWRADPAGHAILTDGGWQAYTGQRDDEIQEFGWLDAVHPDDLPTTRAAFAHAFATGQPLERQHRIRNPEGYRWHLVRHVPVRNEHGVITHWFGAAIDVHDQHALQTGQQFLLKLSDALRPLDDSRDIERTAVDLLGAALGVSRAYYGVIGDDDDSVTVRHSYTDGVDGDIGGHALSAFRPGLADAWRAGRMTVIADSETEPTFGDVGRALYASVSARAAVGMPVVRRGRLVAVLAVNQAAPRVWTDHETALIAEAAERTWLAIERAQAEAALRESEERLRQFGEASQDILWIRDAETFQWVYLTPAFEMIYGLDRATALRGDNMTGWLELIVLEDRDRAAANLDTVKQGLRVTFEFRVRRPSDGQLRWMRNTDFPIRDASGKVVLIGGVGHDITPIREAEQALAAAEARQRVLMEGIPQLVWRSCDKGDWTWASPQWLDFTGQTQEQSHGGGWLDVIHPDDRAATVRAWDDARPHGMLDVEYRVLRAADGAWVWHHTRSVPVCDDDGRIVEWLGTSTDIQNLRELQERQQVLVTELQHRTFNLLGVVRSTADSTIRSSESLDEFKSKFRDRIDALARAQRLLSRLKEGDRVTFDELIKGELTAAGALQELGRVTLVGPDGIALRSSTVQTFAMAIHELTTNALKYGALKQAGAHLDVRWRVEPGIDDRPWLHVDWVESGVAMPSAGAQPTGTGQGRSLIEEALPYQLHARTTYVMAEDGVHCSIALPVSYRSDVRKDLLDA